MLLCCSCMLHIERCMFAALVCWFCFAQHFYYKSGTAPEHLEKIATEIGNADSVVIVTCEYNHRSVNAILNVFNNFKNN